MTALSRRSFSRLVAASLPAAILLPKIEVPAFQQTTGNSSAPQTIAGHSLTEEEKELVAKFTASQETKLSSLREQDLANSLSPTFVPLPPIFKSGESRR